jgi:2-dehydropantoate 2-reductase
MSEKYRIAVLGIGGVGGYFGGKLAEHFADSKDVEIIFIARGENAKAIKTKGLQVITTNNNFIAKPKLITDEPSEIGVADVFLVCAKAYDLAESINKYRDCIGENTAVLPLLNGVNHAETIKQILPDIEVWNGCVFIVARLIEKGIVKVDSEIKLLQFGSLDGANDKLESFKNVLKTAGIDVELSLDIEKTVWEKFIFISSLATLTSAFDKTVGEVLSSEENTAVLKDLIAEVTNLARAKKINVADNIEEITLEKIRKAPPTATSSMHADFAKKGKTELETLTGYVVNEASLFEFNTVNYTWLYGHLKQKT